MEELKIDVLFPFYGDVELMKIAVQSVLDQTYQNWELHVYDDGNPGEETAEFFNKIGESDARVHYSRNETNLGANRNYEKAIENACAPYFVMMGADDKMHPNFLARFVEVQRSYGSLEMYQPMVNIIDEHGTSYLPLTDRVKRFIMPSRAGLYAGELIAESYISGWHYFPSIIWNTRVAQQFGFDEKYNIVQDVDLGVKILQRGGSLYFDKNYTTFSYRRHLASDSMQAALDGRRFQEEKNFFVAKEAEFRQLGWNLAAKKAKKHYYSRLHALFLVPLALRTDRKQVRKLIRHILNHD
ncbi:MAG: glycosyltransferase [Streptococcaceae bacterium]|jgi:glycosyltransferase involved in cell wall biosynthesis|nr:glycosyltransferase [Streptococcaceae bacterium]